MWIGLLKRIRKAATRSTCCLTGRYRLEVSRDGFATQTTLIDVQSETAVSRTIAMAIGRLGVQSGCCSATPLPGVELQLQDIAAPVQSGSLQDIQNERSSGSVGLLESPARRRPRQRGSREPVSGRLELSWTHRFPPAWNSTRPIGIHGRRPPQPAVRRRCQLGFDSTDRHRRNNAHAGIQSSIWSQHTWRRDFDGIEDGRRQTHNDRSDQRREFSSRNFRHRTRRLPIRKG